jgi:hypothetical protein
MKNFLLITTLFFSAYGFSQESEYQIEFGVVIHNKAGEPIGFEQTTTIPINSKGNNSLYGMVITRDNTKSFKLGSVHILPKNPKNWKKVIGKSMNIEKKGAVFMRTSQDDPPGIYLMEIYIDSILFHTFEYQLIESI